MRTLQRWRRTGEPTAEAPAFPIRIAAIDVGSNAIRFMAAVFNDHGSYEVLEQVRCSVRLGHDVFLTGRLAKDAMAAALEALKGFRNQIAAHQVQYYRAVATSAVRDSRNGAELIDHAHTEAGIDLEIINGAEEARLAHIAVSRRIELGDRRWVLADLGGGSVEVSIVDVSGIQWTESNGMGSVRLLEELTVAGDEPGRFRRRLEEYTATLRLPVAAHERLAGFIATGGNIEALARLMDAPVDANGVATVEVTKLRSTIAHLAGLSYQQRVTDLGLREDRADVILPAAMVYERLAHLARMETILVPNVGIKDGVLVDLAEELVPSEKGTHRLDQIAWAGAVALGRRYAFDAAHAEQVARLVLSLFDQLTELHGLDADDRRVLLAAALLHDVGTIIGFKRHHKHSLYIISESELPGFSRAETDVIANIARYHRKSTPADHHEPFMKLSAPEQEIVWPLAALLRVADALDREHMQSVRDVVATVKDGEVVLRIEGDGDLLLERWAVQRKAATMFEEMFELDVRVKE